jgi:hypothetical protein
MQRSHSVRRHELPGQSRRFRLVRWNVHRPQPLLALQRFLEGDMRTLLMIGLASLVTATTIPQTRAQDLGRIFHGITEPYEARRYEEQAHRNGRQDEERYWQRYGSGLQEHRAHQNGRQEEERYWHRYGEGLR